MRATIQSIAVALCVTAALGAHRHQPAGFVTAVHSRWWAAQQTSSPAPPRRAMSVVGVRRRRDPKYNNGGDDQGPVDEEARKFREQLMAGRVCSHKQS